MNIIEEDLNPFELNEEEYLEDEFYENYIGSRAIIKNYANPLSHILTLLYESLLARVNRKINMKLLKAIRYKTGVDDHGLKDGKFYLYYKVKELINGLSKTENIVEKLIIMLEDIINKTYDVLEVYTDLSEITKIRVNDLANFCKEMALIELNYLTFNLNDEERFLAQDSIVEIYTNSIKDKLIVYGLSQESIDVLKATNYLKCVF